MAVHDQSGALNIRTATASGQGSLRVGYMLKRFPRLSETFILNELLELQRQGTPVEVFALIEPDEKIRHGMLTQLRARINYLPEDSWVDACCIRQGGSTQGFRHLRPFADGLPDDSVADLERLKLKAAVLATLVRASRIEHLHAHFASDAATVAMLASQLAGISYSFTAHAKDIYHESVDTALLKEKIRGAKFVITVCDHNREFLAGLAGRQEEGKVIRLYNGVDLDLFRPGPAGQTDESLILAVGRFVEKKGFSVLIEACRILRDQGLPCSCDIVGQGELGEQLARQICQATLQDRVRLVGPRSQEELRTYYKGAAMLVMPCIVARDGNRDALPTVMLEAMACGLPVIASRVTGTPEIVGHEQTGLVVKPGDPDDLANAIARLMKNPDLRNQLGDAGRAKAETYFNLKTNVTKLRQLLNEGVARVGVA